jgi:hypothetical protein
LRSRSAADPDINAVIDSWLVVLLVLTVVIGCGWLMFA